MSYDIRFAVKVDGTDIMANIGSPEYDSPTYNLGKMFRACTGWDYNQGEYYKCAEVLPLIENGIKELRCNRSDYLQYEPGKGLSTLDDAIKVLESMREGIFENAEKIPIEHLYICW
jgi:hypothetical protein